MEATRFGPSPQLFAGRQLKFKGERVICSTKFCSQSSARKSFLKSNCSEYSRKQFWLYGKSKNISYDFNGQNRGSKFRIRTEAAESFSYNRFVPSSSDSVEEGFVSQASGLESVQHKNITFKNRFLNFVKLGSVLNNAAESFFKSEIRRRLFVTAVLLVISRVGYFIPLPGFDRRLIPENYLSFASGSADELGDWSPELKLSFFQLGISPQIAASILMQAFCHIIPSLVKLRKEGLDGHEKIKSYMCVWLFI